MYIYTHIHMCVYKITYTDVHISCKSHCLKFSKKRGQTYALTPPFRSISANAKACFISTNVSPPNIDARNSPSGRSARRIWCTCE